MSEQTEDLYGDVPMTVNIEKFGQTLEFGTYSEIAEWAEKERGIWEPLNAQHPQFSQAGGVVASTQVNFFAQLHGQAQGVEAHKQNAGQQNKYRQQVRNIMTTLAAGKRPTSASATGKQILAKLDDDPVGAMALLAWEIGDLTLQSKNQNINLFQFVQAMVDARLDQREGIGDVYAQNEALTELYHNWDEKLSGQLQVQADEGKVLQESQGEALDHIEERSKKLVSTGAFGIKNLRRDLKDHRDEMDRIRRTFREEMRLRAPATYWRKKAWGHRVGAAVSFIAFAVLVVAFAWTITHEGPGLLKSLSDANGDITLAAAIVVTIPALAAFWTLRLISRVFVSNVTLASDAGQRDIMVQTYLALMADENSQVGDEDRILILNALFRPTDGHGSDDAPPLNLLEIMKEASKVK